MLDNITKARIYNFFSSSPILSEDCKSQFITEFYACKSSNDAESVLLKYHTDFVNACL